MRLVGKAYYCFLDGYSSYNQITMDPLDQEKTTFTCLFAIFTYKKKCHLTSAMLQQLFRGVYFPSF